MGVMGCQHQLWLVLLCCLAIPVVAKVLMNDTPGNVFDVLSMHNSSQTMS